MESNWFEVGTFQMVEQWIRLFSN